MNQMYVFRQFRILWKHLNSPVAITDVTESENEINAYHNLLVILKDDGFKAFSIYNDGISQEEFHKNIASLLKQR